MESREYFIQKGFNITGLLELQYIFLCRASGYPMMGCQSVRPSCSGSCSNMGRQFEAELRWRPGGEWRPMQQADNTSTQEVNNDRPILMGNRWAGETVWLN